MPLQREDDDDDESYQQEDDGESYHEEDYYEEDEEIEETVKPTDTKISQEEASKKSEEKKEERVAISRRPKKRKKKVFDFAKDTFLTSEARKTTKGGYAHTERSRSRISEANTGNTPWNKGRNRSSADKAKIAAGVRARNRAILLEKLKRLKMTEEEWFEKKREIKYLRERVRRAKQVNEKHKVAEAELKLKAAIDATTEKESPPPKEKKSAEEIKQEEERKREEKEAREKAFTRVVTWTPFSFGDDQQTYKQICPNGGAGGLICCEFCSNKYSSFLSQTVGDMEIQRTHKCGKEVKEVLKFLAEGREELTLAMKVASCKSPPLPRPMPAAEPHPTKQQTRKQASFKQQEPRHAEWNLTSTIDIGQTAVV
jgi:hypothetical protein